MSTVSPYQPVGTQAVLDANLVSNPSTQQNPDGTVAPAGAGRHGEKLVGQVHGRRYVPAARGNMFWASTGAGGTSIIAAGQTTGSFVLYNPATSGVYMELHKLRFTTASTATVVIAGIGIEGSVQVPSGTLTGITVSQMPLLQASSIAQTTANSAAKVKAYKNATITAMSVLGGIGISMTATTSTPGVAEVDFDGTLVTGPGFAINLFSSISQVSAVMQVDALWSEWLA